MAAVSKAKAISLDLVVNVNKFTNDLTFCWLQTQSQLNKQAKEHHDLMIAQYFYKFLYRLSYKS
jgi:hypothetical protein